MSDIFISDVHQSVISIIRQLRGMALSPYEADRIKLTVDAYRTYPEDRTIRTTIETHPSGTYFDFADPRTEMIHVEDIARALSQTARFGGHAKRFYSVAEHALLVHRLVADVAGPELTFAALHHDSHEAYLGDIPTPLKSLLGRGFKVMAIDIDAVIGRKLGFDDELLDDDIIKAADAEALRLEASVLKVSRGLGSHWPSTHPGLPDLPTGAVSCHPPEWVEGLFLAAHRQAYAAVAGERVA